MALTGDYSDNLKITRLEVVSRSQIPGGSIDAVSITCQRYRKTDPTDAVVIVVRSRDYVEVTACALNAHDFMQEEYEALRDVVLDALDKAS